METQFPGQGPAGLPCNQTARLSYKFQRLRERIRQAVQSGELTGKLPGERTLAKKFDANPKTLSKALTDLAAEGLLDRSIGRGTFVRDCGAPRQRQGKWLVICEAPRDWPIADQVRALHPDMEVVSNTEALRPSFVSQFTSVIDLSAGTQPEFHRAMAVRGVPVVLIGREPVVYKTHAVLLDRLFAAKRLTRSLLLRGHRSLLAVTGDRMMLDACRLGASHEPEALITACAVEQLPEAMARSGATAAIGDGEDVARRLRHHAGHAGAADLLVTAIGVCDAPVCPGIYITPAALARTACDLLANASASHPTVLWLTGNGFECEHAASDSDPMRLPSA